MISFNCPACQMKLTIKPEYAGRSAKCPTCKKPLNVPSLDKTQAYVPPQQIDGEESSLDKIGHDGGVTLDNDLGRRMPTTLPGQKPQRSVEDVLAGRKKTNERYVIEGEIARGGMGAVLRAVDCDLRREVAVKFMLDEKDPKKKARFIEEAQITGQLEHPNIVPIHDLGVDSRGRLYFSMKMVKGRTLAQVLDDLRKNPKQAEKEYSLGRLLNVLVNVCNALAYAHARGVINRDLKPGNVMVGEFGEVYLMDWGLAKVLKSDGVARLESGPPVAISGSVSVSPGRSSKVVTNREPEADLTQEGSIVGTPVYMPPEQASGNLQAIDQRSDVYSLGAILYEMLTLAAPIDKDGGYMAILYRVVQGEIVPPEQRDSKRAKAGKIPKELAAIAMKAMAKDQANRYLTVAALRQDIERFQEGRSVSAKPDTPWEMLWKLVKRNKMASFFTVLLAGALLWGSWIYLQAQWQTADAEKKLRMQVEESVPAFFEAAHLYVDRKNLDKALDHLKVILVTNPNHDEALLLKAQIHIVRQEFMAAKLELDKYLQQRPSNADARTLAELCQKGDPKDATLYFAFAKVFHSQHEPALAAQVMLIAGDTLETRKRLLPLYQQKIDTAWHGLGNRLVIDNDGKYGLDLNGCKEVAILQPLSGLPLSSLSLSACDLVADLTPLQGMPLTSLNLFGCGRVMDLTPLQGMPLTTLNLSNCGQVVDLKPLKGMPMKMLLLSSCIQVVDLTPLKGMPLTTLELNSCVLVADLTPVKGMQLTSLELRFCHRLSDLTPLAGMKLGAVFLPPKVARGMAELRKMDSLKTIDRKPAADFWRDYDAGKYKGTYDP